MEYVERYLNYVMSSVQPQLYGNGGPIIMVQVRKMFIVCESSSFPDFGWTSSTSKQAVAMYNSIAVYMIH
jgi:hypothetical protein